MGKALMRLEANAERVAWRFGAQLSNSYRFRVIGGPIPSSTRKSHY